MGNGFVEAMRLPVTPTIFAGRYGVLIGEAEGIRCNSVHPGYIDTPMTERMMSQPGMRNQRTAATPLGRIATVDDITNGVLFLASDESSFMKGSELVIDGGWTAQ